MATNATINSDVGAAAAKAVGQLVSVRAWGDACYVSLPIFYPSGTAVTVKVEKARNGFRVTDSGLAYREIEQVGAERFFASNAKVFAEEIEAATDKRSLVLIAEPDELAAAMADIAGASARMAHKIMAKVGAKGEAEISDHLFERLKVVFGAPRVERSIKIVGPSTKEWEVDAIVNLDDRQAIFQAVPNHHASIYSTSAMFHDLALKDQPPVTVSVVHDKAALGAFLGILSQAGHVIEEGQADPTYERAAAWPST